MRNRISNKFFASVRNWNEYKLDRTLFNVETVPSEDCNSFPAVKYMPLEKLSSKVLQWLSKTSIDLYFNERMAAKGNEKGRKLFMCDFLKNCRFHEKKDDIFIRATCCAEMKKSLEYDVNVHINVRECLIMKAQCQCPAGVGPGAACKHVSALLYAIEYYAVTGELLFNFNTCQLIEHEIIVFRER